MEAALAPSTSGGHITPGETDTGRVWFKRATRLHPRWRYQLLDWLATRLHIPLARAVPNPGGPAALGTERRRIRELAKAGAPVPRIIAHGPEWHLISDVGRPLRQVLREAEPPQAEMIAREAVAAVRDVHRKGQYLSQAFDRNICLNDGQIAFIDFEDDPGSVFTLAEAQARDLMLLLSSMAAHFEHDTARFGNICMAALDGLPADRLDPLLQSIGAIGKVLSAVPGAGRLRETRRLLVLADCVNLSVS